MTAIQRDRVTWGETADGAPLAFDRIRLTGPANGNAGPRVILVGGVHGDEHEAPLALLEIARLLAAAPVRGTVTLVPFANGPALTAGTRTSPLDGLNLARIFPGDRAGGPSHRLAAALFAEVLDHEILVDGHSGGVELHFLPVAGHYAAGPDVPAEVAERSLALARATGLADLWDLPHTRGVLSLEAARRGLAVTGCEVGGRGHAGADSIATYRDLFLRVLAAAGAIPAAYAPPAPEARTRHLAGDWTTAPAAGLARVLVPAGAMVEPGTPLLAIEPLSGADPVMVTAAHAGVVLATRSLSRVRTGDLAVLLARVAEDGP